MSNRRAHGRPAFTLVELLVVIGIIGVLISILIPALSRARGQAIRLQCMSNVRSLLQYTVNYASSNRGWYPPLTPRLSWPYYFDCNERDSDKVDWRARIMKEMGLKRDFFYCPANVEWNKDSLWGDSTATASVWGYTYFGSLQTITYPNPSGFLIVNEDNGAPFPLSAQSSTRYYPSKAGEKAVYKVLWTDLTRTAGGGFYASYGSNHVLGSYNSDFRADPNGRGGANVGYVDGHVEWVPQKALRPRWTKNSGGLDYYGWW